MCRSLPCGSRVNHEKVKGWWPLPFPKGEDTLNYKSPLHQTVSTTPTEFWNDSCSVPELTYAIEHGATGATSNPFIVYTVLKAALTEWKERIRQIIVEHPTWDEEQIAQQVYEEVGVRGSEVIRPVFEARKGLRGRLSIQTNPQWYRDAERLVKQAITFHRLAPNIQVKLPATKAGIAAVEEATAQGVNINATVSFTVPQAIAVAEAVERGLNRRAKEGKPIAAMTPVCTIMVGRLDDWLQVVAQRDAIVVDPGALYWPGIAVMKKAYELYRRKGYRARLLAAAFRHHLHWSELIGGDLSMTIPYEWQVQFNGSDVPVIERMQNPISEAYFDLLYKKFADFRRAYEPEGMTVDEFDDFGPTVRTLRSFTAAWHDLVNLMRDFLLPSPDVK
jgi:transaldolase